MRMDKEGKPFMAFAMEVVIPAREGINKTIVISVSKNGEGTEPADYTVGKRIEVSGTLTFKKRGDNIYFNLSASAVDFPCVPFDDSVTGEMLFRGKTGKSVEEKTDRKGKSYIQFSAFSTERVNDGFEYLWVRFIRFNSWREEWLQAQTSVEIKGELDLTVYKEKLNIACKVTEMSAYVKPPYNPGC